MQCIATVRGLWKSTQLFQKNTSKKEKCKFKSEVQVKSLKINVQPFQLGNAGNIAGICMRTTCTDQGLRFNQLSKLICIIYRHWVSHFCRILVSFCLCTFIFGHCSYLVNFPWCSHLKAERYIASCGAVLIGF